MTAPTTAPATSMRVHVYRDGRAGRWHVSLRLPGRQRRELPPCRTLAEAIEAIRARVVGWRRDGVPVGRRDTDGRAPLSLRELRDDEYVLVAIDHDGYTPVFAVGDLWAETEVTP